MNAQLLLAGLMALLPASAAVAAESAGCLPVVENQWVRSAPPGAKTLAGYLVLRNPCEAPVVVDSRMRPAGLKPLSFTSSDS